MRFLGDLVVERRHARQPSWLAFFDGIQHQRDFRLRQQNDFAADVDGKRSDKREAINVEHRQRAH